MYEELIKRLRSAIGNRDEKCEGCPYEEDYPCCVDRLDELLKQAADAIEELTNTNVGKWIPVTERLPNEKDRYLTVSIEPWFGTTVVDTMRWSGVWMYDGRETDATVTHWMPLPEPPKEET